MYVLVHLLSITQPNGDVLLIWTLGENNKQNCNGYVVIFRHEHAIKCPPAKRRVFFSDSIRQKVSI